MIEAVQALVAVPARFGVFGSLNALRAAANAEEFAAKEGAAMVVKRKSTILGTVLALLAVCEAASLIVLFDRVSGFSTTQFQNIIPLTESNGTTTLTMTTKDAIAEQKQPASILLGMSGRGFQPAGIIPLANPSYKAYDENTVWKTETPVEIFHLSYHNDLGEITVIGTEDNEDKLIAPGTSNQYTFTLENSGDIALDYHMDMEAWVSGTDLDIPVRCRVWDYQRNYLLGSNEEKEPVLLLNNVNQDGVLGPGRYAIYTLEWEWPFEQGIDEYDTLLGNLAVDGDLALTMKINTIASCDADPTSPEIEHSGVPGVKTGDDTPIGLYFVIFLCAFLIFLLTLILAPKDKKSRNTDE